jgi:hypothetical protein
MERHQFVPVIYETESAIKIGMPPANSTEVHHAMTTTSQNVSVKTADSNKSTYKSIICLKSRFKSVPFESFTQDLHPSPIQK